MELYLYLMLVEVEDVMLKYKSPFRFTKSSMKRERRELHTRVFVHLAARLG
jgi:hypothetical protein